MADDEQQDEQQGGGKEHSGARQRRSEIEERDGDEDGRAGGQAQAVKYMLTKIEDKDERGIKMKATMGDYIRLVQLHKELDDESPKEIRVTWVEPVEKGSGKEE